METMTTVIQTNFLMNMRTGNIVIDTFLTIILLYLSKRIMEKVPQVWEKILNLYDRTTSPKSEYMIQGTVTISVEYCSHFTNFPDEYKAVMYKINQMNIDIQKCKQFNTKDKYNSSVTTNLFSYSVNTENEIKVTDDIYIKQCNNVDKSSDLKASIEFYNLYIYSYTLNFVELKKIIDEWTKDYMKYVKEYNDGNIYFISYTGKKDNKTEKTVSNEIIYESHKFDSNKRFDNIFFEDKEKLLDRLNYYLNNKAEYKRLGIPYTIGLMFHGVPGCGKSATIKAIANMTQRHIIEIPLSKIKTCGELKSIFFTEMINGHYIPPDKKIIVLEDIDCMGDVVLKRDSDTLINITRMNARYIMENMKDIDSKDDNNHHGENNYKLVEEREKKKMEIYDKLLRMNYADEDDKLTLSYILNLIDGVLEQPGRILIITTNYPEKLDEALLRPGRIDIKINFTKCTKLMCQQIIEFYYTTKLTQKYIDKLENDKWTPAELFQKCFHYDNIDNIIKIL